jgi:hypothetical protein
MVLGAFSQPVAPTLPRFDAGAASFSGRRPATPARTVMPGPISGSTPQMSTTSLGAGESTAGLEIRRHRGVWIGLGAFGLIAIIAVAVIIRSTQAETPSANAATKVDRPEPATVKTPPTPDVEPAIVLLRDRAHVRDVPSTLDKVLDAAAQAQPVKQTPATQPQTQTTTTTQPPRRGPEDPYTTTTPQTTTTTTPPTITPAVRKDPPKETGPKPCSPSDPKCGL